MNLLGKLRSLFRRSRLEAEMAEEMRHHLEEQTTAYLRAGMSPDEASYAARQSFGHLDGIKEQARDARAWLWLEQWRQDVRYAGRQLHRSPGFAATAIITVAVGIGACTALFSIVNGVLLRPLPFPESERIVMLSETRPLGVDTRASPAVYLEWARQSSSFEHLAVLQGRSYLSMASGRGEKISAQSVTATSFFPVFGVQPILGRVFSAAEENEESSRVVILSHRFWQNHFGGRETVLNETIELDDESYAVVGVMPDIDFIWNPAVFTPKTFSTFDRTDYGSHGLVCVGRLKTGISIKQAQSDLDVVSSRIAQAHPDTNEGRGARVTPLLVNITGDVRLQLFILLGAMGVLLLIAGINVADLLLVRASAREREISVRAALGASRGRIVRQFLCESLLITATGGVLGVLFAYGSMGMLAQFASGYVPRTDQIVVDGTVLTLTFGLMLVIGLGAGLMPALQSTRNDGLEMRKNGGRGSSAGKKPRRIRSVLVVVEIALTLLLLSASGLLARSWLELQRAGQGFDAKDVYLTQFDLGTGRKYDTGEKIAAFAREAITRISALPDVHSVALTTGQPMIGFEGLLFRVEGSPQLPTTAMPLAHHAAVTPDYLQAMRIPLKQGRVFTTQDVLGAPWVAIISEELARRYFPGVDPIGQRIMVMTMADKPDVWREIIGIAGDIRPGGPQSEIIPQVYEPLAQRPKGTLALVVRARASTPSLPVAVSDAIRTVDPSLPLPQLRDFGLAMANAWYRQQFSLVIFLFFSAIALLLAVVGVYGVMAYAVERRTQEIGIRMALGSRPEDVLRLIMVSGVRMVGIGIVFGAASSFLFGRVLQSLLFNTSLLDPVILLSVASLVAFVALLGCWLPARRAAKVDPMVALRAE